MCCTTVRIAAISGGAGSHRPQGPRGLAPHRRRVWQISPVGWPSLVRTRHSFYPGRLEHTRFVLLKFPNHRCKEEVVAKHFGRLLGRRPHLASTDRDSRASIFQHGSGYQAVVTPTTASRSSARMVPHSLALTLQGVWSSLGLSLRYRAYARKRVT